ncbi:unnamed protein product [Owenia fusiformis]|uniref:Uncharacterized protein n=1 Tax=Owenia fusiformis TaxID=6347 RepID=A0A8S4NQC8_OWEFU|nr:unnamed protein product [Owenia fusiformis]
MKVKNKTIATLGIFLLCLLYLWIQMNTKDADFHSVENDNLSKIKRSTLDLNDTEILSYERVPLLTLFTTFSEREVTRFVIQNNTILNWCNLQRDFGYRLVVFYSINHTIETLRETAYHATQNIRHTTGDDQFACVINTILLTEELTARGRPIFKNIYLEIQRRFRSKLYAYCNGDIIFHGAMFDASLLAVMHFTTENNLQEFMIYGGRREMPFFKQNQAKTLKTGNDTEILNLGRQSRVKHIIALDYFICSKDSFNWQQFPDFLVSVQAFDTFLAIYSNKIGIATFDVTLTSIVVHQAGAPKLKDDGYKDARELNQFLFLNSVPGWNADMMGLKCMKYITFVNKGITSVKTNPKYTSKTCVYPKPIFAPVLDKEELLNKNLRPYFRKDLDYYGGPA